MHFYDKALRDLVDELPKNKVSKSIKRDLDPKEKRRCELAREVFFEAIEMVKNGVITWDEAIEDIKSNLEVIKDMKIPEKEEEEEELVGED